MGISRKSSLMAIVFTVSIYSSLSQPAKPGFIYPEVGKSMPHFTLYDVHNFSKKKVKLRDFRGKWLVLEWWTQFCPSCVEGFPKLDTLQRRYGDKMQFFLIGYTGSTFYFGEMISGDRTVRGIYNKAKDVFDLKVPIAYDSVQYNQFNLGTTPYIVIINPKGVVKGITTHLSEEAVIDFLANRHPSLLRAYSITEKEEQRRGHSAIQTPRKDVLDTNSLYHTLISKWRSDMLENGIGFLPNEGKCELIGFTLERLIQFAFTGKSSVFWSDSLYGKLYPRIISELTDSSLFVYDSHGESGRYCYSLSVEKEKASKEFMLTLMKNDLQTFFGITVSIENKNMPYWKLVASDQARILLKSKGTSLFVDNKSGGFVCNNCSVNAAIISTLWNYNQDSVIVNETGIEGNIDIKIDGLLTNFADFKRALNVNGLDLVRSEKKMLVIVARKNRYNINEN